MIGSNTIANATTFMACVHSLRTQKTTCKKLGIGTGQFS